MQGALAASSTEAFAQRLALDYLAARAAGDALAAEMDRIGKEHGVFVLPSETYVKALAVFLASLASFQEAVDTAQENLQRLMPSRAQTFNPKK